MPRKTMLPDNNKQRRMRLSCSVTVADEQILMQKWPLYTGLYFTLQNYTAVIDIDQTPVLPLVESL